MNKRFLYIILSASIIPATAIIWLLCHFDVIGLPPHIEKFDLHVFFLCILLGYGALNLISGFLRGNWLALVVSSILLGGALIYILVAFVKQPVEAWVIILCVIALVGIINALGILRTGGKTSFTGKNEVVGYKNYEKRQKIKEREEEKEEKIRQKKIKKGEIEEPKIKSFK